MGEEKRSCRPYVAGAMAGLLAVASVALSTLWLGKPKYLGASTSFVRAAGYLEQTCAADHVLNNAYFAKTKVKVDWQLMFVAGIFVGALVASLADRSFRIEGVPPVWRERFGNCAGKRAVGAFAGGAIALFGARMAGGCPSGHGMSGLMQLAVSGVLALTAFFLAGVIVANLVYRRKAEVPHE